MAWTTPMTAVSGNALSAAQFNTHVRDNFQMLAPHIITTAGRFIVATGNKALAERQITSDEITAFDTRNVGTYGHIGTPNGPQVSLTTGTMALAMFSARMYTDTTETACVASVRVTGATTVDANDEWAISIDGIDAGTTTDDNPRIGGAKLFTGLTPGTNQFTMLYRNGGGSSVAGFMDRHLVVWAF